MREFWGVRPACGAGPAQGGRTRLVRTGYRGARRRPVGSGCAAAPPRRGRGGGRPEHRGARWRSFRSIQANPTASRRMVTCAPRAPVSPHAGGAPERPGADSGAADAAPATAADREAALPRIATEVNTQHDLVRIFDDVLDHSRALFGADKAGLWILEDDEHPFRLAAHRGLGADLLATIADVRRGSTSAGWRAVEQRRTLVLRPPWADRERRRPSPPRYDDEGFRTTCLVPLVYADEPLGVLALYHATDRPWLEGGARPRRELRRPGRHRPPERAALRQRPRLRRPPRRHPGPGRPAEPPPRPGRDRPGDRGRGARPLRLGHRPGLPRRPCRRDVRADRVRGHVPGRLRSLGRRPPRADRHRAHRLGGRAQHGRARGRRADRPAAPRGRARRGARVDARRAR